jgi:hypothetical protein
MVSLQSLLEHRTLLDVLESQRSPEKSVLMVESRKPGFEFMEARPLSAASQRSAEISLDNSSSAQCSRYQRSGPLAEEGASPNPLFSNT